jgi:hypothetical protein
MTFWIVHDSGIDERISRLWMLLMMRFFILYFIAPLRAPLMIAPPYEATVKDAEVPSAPEASDTGAEIVTESAEAPKVLGADEVKHSIR